MVRSHLKAQLGVEPLASVSAPPLCEEGALKYREYISWRRALLDSQLPSTTKHVLLTLACYHSEAGSGIFPSIETLASDCSLSERAIVTHIFKAASEGWVEVSQHGYAGRKWRRNEYKLTLPEDTRGGELRSSPHAEVVNEALNVIPRGGERDDTEVVNDVQSKYLREVIKEIPEVKDHVDACEEKQENVGEVFKLLKRYYRQKIGKSIGTPGSYGEAFAAAVQRSSGDVVLAAGKLWVDELDKTFMRTVRWPFAMFMKHIEQRLEEYEDQKIAASQSDENGEEPDPRRSMLRTDQGRKILEKYS